MALGDGLSECYALRAGPDWVGSVLYISPADEASQLGQDHGTNAEPAVRAVCRIFGGDAVSLECVELF